MTTSDHLGPVRIVQSLEVDELPTGKVVRLLIELTQSGMGLPQRIPVLVARGRKPGPVFGITSALHGNEINGIPVLHRLFDRLDLNALKGTVVGVVVANLSAFHLQHRLFEANQDLNHIMPGREHGSSAEVYAHRLFTRVISQFDWLADLHTASVGRINSLYVRADLKNPITAQMAHRQRPQIIVHNPPIDKTLRGAAMLAGIPAITLEIGNPQRFQPELIRRSLTGIRAMLADAGMVPKRKLATSAPPVLCASSYWLYTDQGGLLEVFPDITDRVSRGDVVARLSNVFGDLLREYHAPEDGIVIGKSVNPVGPTGARILHLGIEARPEDELIQLQATALSEKNQ